MSKYVCIYHGPYESFNTISHKPQKLRGLKDRLLRYGYRVDLIPSDFRNYCVIKMKNVEIFRCNIKHLQFNVPLSSDPVAQRALAAILDATKRFQIAEDYLWIRSVLMNDVLNAAVHVPKNYWINKDIGCLCLGDLEELSQQFTNKLK